MTIKKEIVSYGCALVTAVETMPFCESEYFLNTKNNCMKQKQSFRNMYLTFYNVWILE